MEGLHWVLNYYHHGCRSWDWYFPHLYAPLGTDLYDLGDFYNELDEEGFGSFKFEKVRVSGRSALAKTRRAKRVQTTQPSRSSLPRSH